MTTSLLVAVVVVRLSTTNSEATNMWTLRHFHVIFCAWLLALSCQSFHYSHDQPILSKHVAAALASRPEGNHKPDVGTMRARELRKLLVKLGYERNELKKIIDKQELRNLAHDLLAEQAKEEETKQFRAKAWYYSLLAGGLGLAYLMYEPFLILLSGLKDWFRGQSYQTTLRFKLVRKSIEHRYPLATLALIIATMIDIFQPTAQLSIMLSWIIPHGSFLRRFLLPMPNFSLTLNNVLGMQNGNSRTASTSSNSKGLSGSAGANNWSHNIGDYGLNVAPMILMTGKYTTSSSSSSSSSPTPSLPLVLLAERNLQLHPSLSSVIACTY